MSCFHTFLFWFIFKGIYKYKLKLFSNTTVFSTNKGTAFYRDKLSLEEILSKVDEDFVIVEGFKEELSKLNIPKIVLVKDNEGLELIDDHTIMVIKDYAYDVEDVLKLVLEKAIVPSFNLNCGHCGYDCKSFVSAVDIVKFGSSKYAVFGGFLRSLLDMSALYFVICSLYTVFTSSSDSSLLNTLSWSIDD